MAVLGEVIAMVDEIKPNAFSDEAKTAWLNECEGMVQTEVFLFAPAEIIRYRWPEDRDKPLLVEPPHDKLYWAYLTAMIDFANGEYNKYQNTMQTYNEHYANFLRWFGTTYDPAEGYISEEARAHGDV